MLLCYAGTRLAKQDRSASDRSLFLPTLVNIDSTRSNKLGHEPIISAVRREYVMTGEELALLLAVVLPNLPQRVRLVA